MQYVVETRDTLTTAMKSRARMVPEGAYGRLKWRWRFLIRKCESAKSTVNLDIKSAQM